MPQPWSQASLSSHISNFAFTGVSVNSQIQSLARGEETPEGDFPITAVQEFSEYLRRACLRDATSAIFEYRSAVTSLCINVIKWASLVDRTLVDCTQATLHIDPSKALSDQQIQAWFVDGMAITEQSQFLEDVMFEIRRTETNHSAADAPDLSDAPANAWKLIKFLSRKSELKKIADIAVDVALSESTVSKLIKYLCEKGLIDRPGKKRSGVRLNPLGRSIARS